MKFTRKVCFCIYKNALRQPSCWYFRNCIVPLQVHSPVLCPVAFLLQILFRAVLDQQIQVFLSLLYPCLWSGARHFVIGHVPEVTGVFFPFLHRPGVAQGLFDGGDVCGCEGTDHRGAPLDNRLDGSRCIRPEGKEPVSPAFGIGFSRFPPPFRPLLVLLEAVHIAFVSASDRI